MSKLLGMTSGRQRSNISLKLTPKVHLWFVGMPFPGVRFALVIRRGSSTLCYAPIGPV
jgi:hypothetical protein